MSSFGLPEQGKSQEVVSDSTKREGLEGEAIACEMRDWVELGAEKREFQKEEAY